MYTIPAKEFLEIIEQWSDEESDLTPEQIAELNMYLYGTPESPDLYLMNCKTGEIMDVMRSDK